MTTLTGALEIGEALTRLAVARGGLLGDTESDVYLDRLQRFVPALVVRACAEWSDVPRKPYEAVMPPVGDIIATVKRLELDDAMRASTERLLPMPQAEDDEPRFFCRDCHDEPSAWVTRWCAGIGSTRATAKPDHVARFETRFCGRQHAHAPHTFAERCACRDVNPVIARHRQAQRRAS